MHLTVVPIKAKKQDKKFDLFNIIVESLEKSSTLIEEGDVLVISSKFISNSQGRIVETRSVVPSIKAESLSKQFQIEPKIVEIVIRESDVIFGGVSGFVVTSSDNILAPNAGIDKSNTKKGKIILYPYNSNLVAEQIRRKFFLKFSIHVGILIIDSRLMPSRVGTSGIAIACAGIEPINDLRSKKDLDGNPLKVTMQAVADNLASIANHKMGEGSESQPFAIIKNSGARLTSRKIYPQEMTISHDQCVFMRSFNNKIKN